MTRPRLLAVVACLSVLGCEQDRARAVRIVERPRVGSDSVAAISAAFDQARRSDSLGAVPSTSPLPTTDLSARRSKSEQWRPQGCPPPYDSATGQSDFTAIGPCTFEHRRLVNCEALDDDFLLVMSRPAARGATLMVFINVEFYKGPGTYDGAQMFVGVQDKSSINRWSSDSVHITVGPNEDYALLPKTLLEAEPLLVDCSGPMNNYQCSGRLPKTPIEQTTEVVSGKLWCAKKSD